MQSDQADNEAVNATPDPQPAAPRATGGGKEPGGFQWKAVIALMTLVLVLLALQLVRRFRIIDPVRRCADLYASSRTAVDTTLVDGIKLRVPEDGSRTTCGALRADGSVARMPKRQLRTAPR